MYTQLSLFDDFLPWSPSPGSLIPTPQHDPYWDEIEETSDTVTCAFLPSVECKALDFGVDKLFAHQQKPCVGEQLPSADSACKSVGEQVTSDTLKFAHQHDGQLYSQLSDEKATHWVEKYWVERGTNKYGSEYCNY